MQFFDLNCPLILDIILRPERFRAGGMNFQLRLPRQHGLLRVEQPQTLQGSSSSKQTHFPYVKCIDAIFSTEVSAREKQGQSSGEPHQGVIGSLAISSIVRPF